MAKDPAFLFYPGDWQGGTMIMTRHIKGCYIDLLMAQFNSGPLSLEEIKTVLGTDQASWTVLSKKFKKTETGLFFNERLEAEKAKRAEYSIKQKNRVDKRWNKSGIHSGNTVVLPINENEIKNEDEIKDFGKGEEKPLTFSEITNTIEFIDRIKQVKLSESEVLNYWAAFNLNGTETAYFTKGKKIQHFRNWLKNQKEKVNGKESSTRSGKTNSLSYDKP